MPSYEKYDFNLEKQRAAQRLKDMSARSKYKGSGQCNLPPKAETGSGQSEKPPDFLSGADIPILSDLKLDPDIALILGLLLILSAEKSDNLLILALLYILI